MTLKSRLRDDFALDGLHVENVPEKLRGKVWYEEHECGSHDDIVTIPLFYAADVGIRTDKIYDHNCEPILRAKDRFEPYEVENAVFVHSQTLFLGIDDYRLATIWEAACALVSARFSYGSLRAKVFPNADLTLQLWNDGRGIIATKDGSGAEHHLLYIPRKIKPQW